MKKHISVVGAVITSDGLVLCAQRGETGELPGMWEFPGGKIESGESMRDALKREIEEELGCSVEVGRQIESTTHEYDFGAITLTTFYCQIFEGTPLPKEHLTLKWVHPSELNELDWAPADIPAVTYIQMDLM